jgi:aspartyl-tRNA(Asn)/glutamyl-tRNA(Gln) amidotransferase subunit B
MHEGLPQTRVDLNRAGTPLLEIVTQPDIADADEAYSFCVELQRLVQFLGISEANMQKGQMRFEPNVNVAITVEDGREFRTPISEVKNLNSFRSVRGAIRYEIDRQVREWQADHDYTLEKRGKMNFGWDDAREVTEFQRGKEESHDYRYFPDPDLVPVSATAEWIEARRSEVGELPVAKQRRYMSNYGISAKDAEIILADKPTSDFFEGAIEQGADVTTLTKHFLGFWNHLASARNTSVGRLGIQVSRIADLVRIVSDGQVSATAAAQVAERMLGGDDSDPLSIATSLGLIQVRDESATQAWVDQAFAANPQAVADALGSNERKAKAAPGFLRGQVLKLSAGKADPRLTGELIERKLKALREESVS